ncbi:hypothetical protein [Bacillus cereus]|uniref:hypothetical protein n=1 Tax=Bacillus cereus TaxID=1396 RepID=UPI0039814EB6
MNYQKAIEKAVAIRHEAQRRERIQQIVKEYRKPFRKVFQDVVNNSHRIKGYHR